MERRGASVIIGWVLLVGLAVTMGVIVSQWVKEQAESTAASLVEEKTQETRCMDVSIAAFLEPGCAQVNVTNRGLFTVHQVGVRSQFGTETVNMVILPRQTQALNIQTSLSSGDRVDVIPVIKIDDVLASCAARKVSVTC